jgi:hypothetical protein
MKSKPRLFKLTKAAFYLPSSVRTPYLIGIRVWFCLLALALPAAAQWRTGYFMQREAAGQTAATIPWSKYTHVIHSALRPTYSGGVCDLDATAGLLRAADIEDFVSHAHAAGVKAIIGIRQDETLEAITACTAPQNIAQFVERIRTFVANTGYDGLDFDWENSIITPQYRELIRRLRTALPTAILSVVVGFTERFMTAAVQYDLDQINVRGYHLDSQNPTGSVINYTSYRSPELQGANSPDQLLDILSWDFVYAGNASSKLGLAVPFYGQITKGCMDDTGTTGVTDPNQAWVGRAEIASIPYRDLVKSRYWSNGSRVWDDFRKSQYIRYRGGSCTADAFLSYLGPEQLHEVVALVRANKLGGIATFGLPYEYLASQTGDARYPISTVLYDAMTASPVNFLDTNSPETAITHAVEPPRPPYHNISRTSQANTGPPISVPAQTTPRMTSTVTNAGAVTFTYYVDSANGSDSNPGTITKPWKTIAKVNATTLQPGQSVGFNRGGLWREMLMAKQSGAAGSPITFGVYGTGAEPQILGSSSASSTADWTQDTGTRNCWYTAALAAVPTFVWRDNVFMRPVTSEALLASGADTSNYYFNSVNKKVYVYATSNPTTGGHAFEIGQRAFAFYALGKSYLVIHGLTGKYTNNAIFNLDTGSSYCIIDGVAASFGMKGIRTSSTTGNQVSNSVVSYVSDDGISFMSATNGYIFGNDISHAGMLADDRSGISIFQVSSGNAVYSNVVHDSGSAGPVGCRGIILDTVLTTGANDVYGNLTYNNSAAGILVYWSDNQRVYYNISHDNTHDISSPFGMGIGVKKSVGTVVYNNTTYHNQFAEIYGATIEGVNSTGTVAENNLSVMAGTTHYGIAFDNAANTADYNLVYSAAAGYHNLYNWAGVNYISKTTFYVATGQGQHDINADPLFANSPGGDFTLLPGSPAIRAGIYIAGVSTAKPPNMGAK